MCTDSRTDCSLTGGAASSRRPAQDGQPEAVVLLNVATDEYVIHAYQCGFCLVGRSDNERRQISQCERAANNRLPLI